MYLFFFSKSLICKVDLDSHRLRVVTENKEVRKSTLISIDVIKGSISKEKCRLKYFKKIKVSYFVNKKEKL